MSYIPPIETQGLSRAALAVLDKTNRLIAYYQANKPEQKHITLFKRDYDTLAKSLKANKQDINNVRHQGFTFKQMKL